MKKTYFLAAIIAGILPISDGLQAGDYSKNPGKEVIEPIQDDWEFLFSPYGILPWVDLTLSGDVPVHLDPGNVWDALNMTAQFDVEVRKGDWGLGADVIYVDLGFDLGRKVLRDIRIKEWIISPKVSYRAWEGDWGFFDLEAGMRITTVKLTVNGDIPSIRAGSVFPTGPGLTGRGVSRSGYAAIYDGLAGFRGAYNLTDSFYLDYRGEMGAGDSDFIAQAFLALGYHINPNADVYFGCRYIYYDFASGAPLVDETAFGPQMGLKIRF